MNIRLSSLFYFAMEVPRRKLGSQGLEVSVMGLGCLMITSEEDGIALIKHAFEKGVTFFDTADVYGQHKSEIVLGKALKHLPREKVQLATKFGFAQENGEIRIKGSAEYVRKTCEASLARLGVDYIDLYYQHRVDTTVPIEETMCEIKKLVEEGKVKYVGLSEASVDTIKRAHQIHPISALQLEWSLWTRDIEETIVPTCRELGIGLVPYSPLGRGFFTGKPYQNYNPEMLKHPRLNEENLEKNKVFYERFVKMAEKYKCKPVQLALAWIIHQGDDVVPIPGTTKISNFEENLHALALSLSKHNLDEVASVIAVDEIAGLRYPVDYKFTWTFADTPLKKT